MASSRPTRAAAASATRSLFSIDNESTSESEEDEITHIADIHARSGGHVSSSESSDSDDEAPPILSQRTHMQDLGRNDYHDKDGEMWHRDPPIERRRGAANVFRLRVGPTCDSKKETLLETWKLFWTPEITQAIIRYSQMKADSLFQLQHSVQLASSRIACNSNKEQTKTNAAQIGRRACYAEYDKSSRASHWASNRNSETSVRNNRSTEPSRRCIESRSVSIFANMLSV